MALTQRPSYTRTLSSVGLHGGHIAHPSPTLSPQNLAGTTIALNRSSSPTSCPPLPPPIDNKVDPPSILQCIREVVKNSDEGYVVIPGVDRTAFGALGEDLERENLPRLSYYEETEVLSFKMPSIIHEQVSWFTKVFEPTLAATVLPYGLMVKDTKSMKIKLNINGYSVLHEPDWSFRIVNIPPPPPHIRTIDDPREASVWPAIVVESAYSQTISDAKRKAWEYLHGSNDAIRLVIILDIRKPANTANTNGWKVFVTTWRPSPLGDDDVAYCPHKYTGQGFIFSPPNEATLDIRPQALGSHSASLVLQVKDVLRQDQRDRLPLIDGTTVISFPLQPLGQEVHYSIIDLIIFANDLPNPK